MINIFTKMCLKANHMIEMGKKAMKNFIEKEFHFFCFLFSVSAVVQVVFSSTFFNVCSSSFFCVCPCVFFVFFVQNFHSQFFVVVVFCFLCDLLVKESTSLLFFTLSISVCFRVPFRLACVFLFLLFFQYFLDSAHLIFSWNIVRLCQICLDNTSCLIPF